MDPYLENPALWPDVHNSLIAAIRDALSPRLAPKYYVRLERRTYLLSPDDLSFVGRPDLAVLPSLPQGAGRQGALPLAAAGVVEVVLAIPDEVGENYLEVHEVTTGRALTATGLLSPTTSPRSTCPYEDIQRRD